LGENLQADPLRHLGGTADAAAPRPHRGHPLRDYVEALLVAVVFAVFARTWVVQAFKIPSGSMEPNLLVGDHILVNKFIYGPARWRAEKLLLPRRELRRGDVVVFQFPTDPERDFIKRCVGLPGDVVELRDKRLYVNGMQVEDGTFVWHSDPRTFPRLPLLSESLWRRDNFGPYQVPDGEYFFLGDNRDNSNDSRFWGPVDGRAIKGRALAVYWSSDLPPPAEDARLAERLLGLGRATVGFFNHTRWERTLRLVR
jgi:signal peptidase I